MSDRTIGPSVAGVAFATTGGLVAGAWMVVGTYTGSTETLRDGLTASDLAVFDPPLVLGFVAAAAVSAGLLGGVAWALVVGRLGRWSDRRRGAIAGGLTGLLAVPVTLAFAWAVSPPSAMHPLSRVLAGLFVGAIGTIYVGWTTVPAGALTGYLLCRLGDVPPDVAESE